MKTAMINNVWSSQLIDHVLISLTHSSSVRSFIYSHVKTTTTKKTWKKCCFDFSSVPRRKHPIRPVWAKMQVYWWQFGAVRSNKEGIHKFELDREKASHRCYNKIYYGSKIQVRIRRFHKWAPQTVPHSYPREATLPSLASIFYTTLRKPDKESRLHVYRGLVGLEPRHTRAIQHDQSGWRLALSRLWREWRGERPLRTDRSFQTGRMEPSETTFGGTWPTLFSKRFLRRPSRRGGCRGGLKKRQLPFLRRYTSTSTP